MGLPKADAILREAMAMGADDAVLVTDRVLGGADIRKSEAEQILLLHFAFLTLFSFFCE